MGESQSQSSESFGDSSVVYMTQTCGSKPVIPRKKGRKLIFLPLLGISSFLQHQRMWGVIIAIFFPKILDLLVAMLD